MLDLVLKRFDNPDEIRTFPKGRFEIIQIAGMTIGRAVYEPGWKWSTHVGKALGKSSCDVEHVGMVVSGRAAVAMDDGRVLEMKEGDLFYIVPGHDSWVIGDEPYVSLHFLGANKYAARRIKPADFPNVKVGTECATNRCGPRTVDRVTTPRYPNRANTPSGRSAKRRQPSSARTPPLPVQINPVKARSPHSCAGYGEIRIRFAALALLAVIVQRARRRRTCHARDRAQIFVNCPQVVLGHALIRGPRHDLQKMTIEWRRNTAWVDFARPTGRM